MKKDDCIADRGIASVNGSKVELRYRDCTLISKHELREEDNKELFEGYTQNPRIMNLVKSQGEIADCTVERYGSVIYLIPAEDNDFLGFSKQELKAKLCKSGATDKDYYLSQFVILTMLTEFYDG